MLTLRREAWVYFDPKYLIFDDYIERTAVTFETEKKTSKIYLIDKYSQKLINVAVNINFDVNLRGFYCFRRCKNWSETLTFGTTHAIIKALGFRVETVLVPHTAAVREHPAFPFSLVERPLVYVLLARSWLSFHETPVREGPLGRRVPVHFVGLVALRRVHQVCQGRCEHDRPNEDPEDPFDVVRHCCRSPENAREVFCTSKIILYYLLGASSSFPIKSHSNFVKL